MARSFKLACAQMDCKLGDVNSNLEKIRRMSEQISKGEPDIVVFPELATTGYCLKAKWQTLAEEIPGKASDYLSKIASEFGFYLVCGVDERSGKDNAFDSAILLNPSGRLLGTYRKVHLWDQEKRYFKRGKNFPIFKTKFCKLGIGICYDIEFPESARTMVRHGAELILFPSAEINPMSAQIDSYLMSRSAENCAFVGFSNRVGTEHSVSFFGHSQIISPDANIQKIKTKEGYVERELNLKLLAKMRKRLLPYLSELQPHAYS